MSGRGKGRGTGVPLIFACSKCRKRWPYWRTRSREDMTGTVEQIELTGRQRPNDTGNIPPRSSTIEREFRCHVCGHVGWSRHVDLELLELGHYLDALEGMEAANVLRRALREAG